MSKEWEKLEDHGIYLQGRFDGKEFSFGDEMIPWILVQSAPFPYRCSAPFGAQILLKEKKDFVQDLPIDCGAI